ncbi:DUF5776 domain-containing protein [Apilactobacillus sp. 1-1-2]|uniref:DUF5776 domain-containing protein n=1 Tax=Apilactobacillus sp. 1-1-2 TaxID=3411035 RepID=UPI003B952957
MQYNKKKFNKIKDKKVMKKVKKQWVVMSLSTFATVGGLAYTMTFSHVAHADTASNPASTNPTQGGTVSVSGAAASSASSTSTTPANSVNASYANQSAGSVAVTSATSGNQSLSSQAQSAFNTGLVDLSQTKYSSSGASSAANPASALVSSSQASDVASAANDAVNYNSAMNQAASDAFAGNGNNVATVASNAQNYYNAAYYGASNAKSLYDADLNGYGTGKQDYTAFSQNTNTPTSSASNGTSSAQAATSAHSAALSYESSLNSKFNGKSNVSVHLGATENGQISIPTPSDSQLVNQNPYVQGSELYSAYEFGVNYALSHQGTEDAKNGKWTGISKAQGLVYDPTRQLSFPGDNYHPLANSKNPYDQAYIGAQQAMNDQWSTNDTIQSYGYVLQNEAANPNYINGSAYYQMAYDNVAREMNDNNTAFVHNAWQFQRALAGNYHSDWSYSSFVNGTNSGYSAYNDAMGLNINDGGKGYSTVRLVNDIDFQGDPYVEHWPTIQKLKKLTVDGQNHQVDFHGVLDQFVNTDTSVNPTLIIKNFQMAYSYNYYGFLKINQPGTVIYDNVNYMGAQMLSDWPAGGNDIRFKGNINEINVSTYQTSLNNGIHPTEGNGNQENMEVQNLLLYPGAKYFGSVARDYGNNVIKLSGSLTMNEGSQMTLVPRGNGGYYARLGSNYGIVVTNGANLNINKGASLQIIPDSWNGSNTYANGIYTYGNINVNGGTLDIETAAPSYNSNSTMFVDSTGQVNISNGGLVMVKSQGLGSSSTGSYGLLYNNNGRVNVNNLGNLYISGDGTGATNLLAGPLNITNPGQNNITLDLTQNTNTGSRISNGKIDAYTSLVTYGVGVQGSNGLQAGQTNTGSSKILYSFHLFNQNGNYTNSYVDASGNKSSFSQQGNPNFVQIATVPAVYFVGPMTPVLNSDGTYTLTGYAQVSDRKSTDTDPIYAQVGYGTQNSYPTLTTIGNGIRNTVTIDQNNYTQAIQVPSNYNYELIKYSINMPKDYNPNKNPYVGLLLRYGVDGVDTVAQVQTKQFTSSQHSYDLSSDGKSLVDQSQQVIDTGSYAGISDGRDDALYYLSNGTQASQQRYTDRYKIDDDYTNGYNSVMAGYNAFANGAADPNNNPGAIKVGSVAENIANDDNTITDPQGYIDGYNRAKADAKGTLVGLNDFINGKQQSATNSYNGSNNNGTNTPTAQYTDNYNNAYYNAVQGYQDSKVTTVEANPNSVAYDQGFHAAQNFNQGISDASKGAVSQDSLSNNPAYAVGVNAFNAAKKDVMSGTTTNTNGQVIFTDAYNSAYQQIKSQYDNGAQSFLNFDSNNTSSLPSAYQEVSKQGYQDAIDGYNGTPDGHEGLSGYKLGQSIKSGEQDLVNGRQKDATKSSDDGYNKGYQDALDGFKDAINYNIANGSNMASDNLSGKTQAYKDAVTAAQTATQAIQDAKNDIDANREPANLSSQTKAYQDAYNAYKAAYLNVDKNTQPTNLNSQSDIYQAVYNAEHADIQSKYQQGINDYIQKKSSQSNNDVYGKAYNDAQAAFDDFSKKYDGKSDPSSITPSDQTSRSQAYITAFTYAKNAAVGAYEATQQYGNFNRPTQNDNPAYMDGFNAVRDAYSDASLTKSNRDTSQNSTAYKNVYNDSLKKAQNDYQAAVQDFLKGQKSASNDVLGQQAQQDAALGYQAALSGKTEDQLNDTQKNNAGFMQAYQAAQDAKAGYQAAIDKKDENGKNQDFEDNLPKTEDGKIEDTSSYEAYLGAKDELSGHSISDTVLAHKSIAYQQAYRQAFAVSQEDAEQGVKDYLQGKQNKDSYSSNSNYKNGYDKAKLGFSRSSDSLDRLEELGYQGKLGAQSYLNGNPLRSSALSDGSTQIDAASIGYLEAQNGSTVAINNLSNLTSDSKAPTDKSAAYQLGYQNVIDQVVQGYNKAVANQNSHDFDNIKATDVNYAEYQAYTAAVAGINAAKLGNEDPNIMNVTDSSQITPYIAVYQKAAKAYDNQAKKGKDDFVKKVQPSSDYANGTTTDAMKTAYTNAYNAAMAGFKDHISDDQAGSTTNKTNKPSDSTIDAYNAGYDAYNIAKQGVNDARQASSLQPISVDDAQLYVDGYNAEVQAISDAQNGKNNWLDPAYNGTLSANYKNKDQAFQGLYPSLLADANKAYQQGMSDFLNTNGHDATYTSSNSDKVYQLGFQDAQNGVNNVSDNKSVGYKSGNSYLGKINKGISIAQSSTSSSNSDLPTNDAIRGAAAGYIDSQNGGTAKINPNESLAYNIAYEKSFEDGKNQFVSGAQSYLNGTAQQSLLQSGGYQNQDRRNGYANARSGYFAASENQAPTDAQRKIPTFMMGYNAAVVAMAANQGLSSEQALQKVVPISNDSTDYSIIYQNAYQNAQSGYQYGQLNSTVNPNQAPGYLTGYYAARGAQDFTKGNPQQTQNGITNLDDAAAAQNAYNYGYTQANNGFNDATNNKANSSSQIAAYNDGVTAYNNAKSAQNADISAAITLAQKNFQSNPYKNVDANTQTTFRNNLKNNVTNYNNNEQVFSTIAQIAYLNAFIQASNDYSKGINEFLSGSDNNANVPKTADVFEQQGFNDAKNAYNLALSQNNVKNMTGILGINSTPTISSPATAGNNDGTNTATQIANAFKDLIKNGTVIPQSSSDSNYQTAATAMLQAQNDLISGVPEQDNSSKNNLVYDNAYKLVYEYSKNEYQNGVDSVIKNTQLDNDTFAIQGASNARSGFNDALSGSNQISKNPQYNAGYNAAKAIQKAYEDTMNQPTNSTDYGSGNQNDTRDAVKQALSDFQSNPNIAISNGNSSNGATGSSAGDAMKINGTGISNIVYNTAWNAIQGAAMNGMNNYLFNQHMLNNLTDDQASIIGKQGDGTSGKFTEAESQGFVKGYQDAQNGFKDALAGKTVLPIDAQELAKLSNFYVNGFTEGSQISKAVASATVDGPQGINNPQVIEQAYQEAYQATLDAQNNLKNGKNSPIDDTATHDMVYKTAYNTALSQNTASYKNGAYYFAQNTSLSSLVGQNGVRSDQLDITSNGYNKALEGFNFFKNGNTESNESEGQKNNVAFQIGVQAWKSLQNGYQAALNNANDSSEQAKINDNNTNNMDSHVKNIVEGQAYQGAVDGLNNYLQNGTTKTTNTNPFYVESYNQAVTEAVAKVSQGSQNFLNGNDQNDPNAAPNGSDTRGLDAKALSKGFSDTKSGFDDAATKQLSDTELSQYSAAYQAGYKAKKAALDAYNNVTPAPTDSNQLSVYKEAQNAAAKARQDIANNTISSDSDRSSKDRVYNFIYDQITNDYKNGMKQFRDGQVSATGNSYVQSGFSDEQRGYNEGQQAGLSNNVSPSQSNAGYIDGYNLGKASAIAYNASQNTSTDANSNNKYTADTNGVSAFDGAQDGYKDAISDKPRNRTSRAANEASQKAYNDAYDKAYQTARNEMQSGIDAFTNYDGSDDLDGNGDANNTNKPTSSVLLEQAAIDKGYLDAKAGYKDALKYVKDHPNDSSNDNAGKISQPSQAYDNGYQLGLDVARSLEYTRSHATATTDNNATTDQAKSAFDGAVRGFADGQDTATQHVLDANKSGAYKKAYTIANVESGQQYEQGKQLFLTGVLNNHSNDTNNADDVAFNRGYKETSDGYTDGMKIPHIQNGNSTGYLAGYNKGTAISDSFQSAQDGNQEYTGNDQSEGAFSPRETFDAAKAGFDDAKALNNPKSNADKTISYQNAYNLAYKEYKDAIAKGSQQYFDGNGKGTTDSNNLVDQATARGFAITNDGFNNGYTSASSNSPHTPSDYTADIYTRGYNAGTGASAFVYAKSYDSSNADQTTGYQEAKDGFNFAAAGNDASQIPAAKAGQAAFMKGFNVYTQYKNGIEDGSIKDGEKQSTDADYGNAYQATQAARQQFMHYSNVDNTAHTPIYQSIFDVKGKEFFDQYESGKNAYLSGSNNSGTDFHAQGYQDAIDGFQAGFSSNGQSQTQETNNVGYTESYKAGQSAYKGYLAALADKTNNTSGDSSSYATDGFNGAVQALTDGFNINNPGLQKGMSVSMQNGYNAMIQQAQQAVEDGLNSFAQSLPNAHSINTGSGNSLDKLQKAAYDTTKDGYEAGLAGNFDQTMSNNKAYVQGYNLGKGANEFLNGKPKDDSSLDDSVESQGYKDAESGYAAAVDSNGNIVPQSSLTAQQKADTVFMAGYTAHVNALNAANGTYTKRSNIDSDQYSQYGVNAVNDALTDARNGVKSDVSGRPKAYQDVYNTYFAKMYGNFDDIKDSVNNANSGNSNVDISHENNVSGDYFKAIKQYLNKNTSSLPNNIATDQGIADATKGFMNGISNSPEKLPYAGYTPAYNVGLKLSAGFKAAKADVTKNTADTTNDDENTKNDINESYNGAVAGYQSALSGGSPQDTDSSHSLPYSASYNVAYGIANQNLLNGQNDFLTSAGTNQPSDSNEMEKSSYNFGYNQTRDGYKDAIDGKAQVSHPSASYSAGYSAATNAKSGRDDANSGKAPQDTSNAQYMAGYNATVKARHDAVMTNNQPSDVSNEPLVYQDVYNDEYAKDNKDYITGYSNYVANGNKVSDDSFQKLGYEDTQNGYSDGLKGNTEASSNYGYIQGYEMGQAFKDAYKTAYNDPTQSHTDQYTGSDDAVNTYDAAVQAFKQVSSEKTPADVSQQSAAYQRAYKTAYDQSIAEMNDGSQRFINGLSNEHSNGADADDRAYNQGYVNTQSGYQDGFAAKSVADLSDDNKASATYMTGYNIGKGAQDFVNGLAEGSATITSTNIQINNQENYDSGYAQAQTGYEQRKKGVTRDQLTQAQLNNPAFMSGFDMADEIQQGIQDAINKPTDNYNSNSPHDRAYKAVLDALNDFKQGRRSDVSQQPAAYADAYNDIYAQIIAKANNGSQQYLNGSQNDKAQSQNILDQAYTFGYNNSKDGSDAVYDAAKSGKLPSSTDLTEAQKSNTSFMAGYNNANGAVAFDTNSYPKDSNVDYQAGYADASNGYDAGMSGVTVDQLTPQQQNDKSFMLGFNKSGEALKGYQLAQQAFGNDDNTHMTNSDEDTSFRGAQAGFIDAQLGRPMSIDNVSVVYDKAYQRAYAEWQSHVQIGALDGVNNKAKQDATLNPVDKSAYDMGYNSAATALSDAKINSVNKGTVQGSDKLDKNVYNDVYNAYNSGYLRGYNKLAKDINSADAIYSSAYDQGYALGVKNAPVIVVPDNGKDKPSGNNSSNGNTGNTSNGSTAHTGTSNSNTSNGSTSTGSTSNSGTSNDNHSGKPNKSENNNTSAQTGSNSEAKPTIINTNTVAKSDKVVESFTNGVKETPAAKPEKVKYDDNYKDIIVGFKAGIDNEKVSQKDKKKFYFNQGIELAKIVKIAINDAKRVKKLTNAQRRQQPAAYVKAFDAYKAGVLAEKNNVKNRKAKRINYAKMGTIAEYAFKQGFQVERKQQMSDGTRAGRKRGSKHYHIPKLKNQNVDFVKSYEKAYKKEIKRRLPKYVYNIKSVYTHRSVRFTKGNRVIFYAKRPRYAAHVFKVKGIAFYKNGIPRYRVSGGRILTATPSSMRSAYYSRKNNARHYRVIRPTGVWLHNSKKFSVGNRIKHFRRNSVIKIRKVLKYHGITRLYINSHQYITSNKTFVKETK